MLSLLLSVVRLALQIALFFLLLGAVIGVASQDTGLAEKLALAAIGGALIWLAPRVRRIGAHSSPRPV
jgi:hypothetical protein